MWEYRVKKKYKYIYIIWEFYVQKKSFANYNYFPEHSMVRGVVYSWLDSMACCGCVPLDTQTFSSANVFIIESQDVMIFIAVVAT